MTFKGRLIITALAIFLASVGTAEKAADSAAGEKEKQTGAAVNRFGFHLFQKVAAAEDDASDLFISPLSVSLALSMTVNGAENATRDEIISTVEFMETDLDYINDGNKALASFLDGLDSQVVFNIANSIWYRSGLPVKESFIDINKAFYDALVREINFNMPSAAQNINDWVGKKTNGKIEKIVEPPLDQSAIMFLINAVYFKGDWGHRFDSSRTRNHPFYPSPKNESTCRMMFNTETYGYLENELFQAAAVPYGKGDFEMIVLLPKPEISASDLIDRLNEQNWAIWTGNLHKTEIILGLPKFKLEYEKSLNDILKSMGMKAAFDGQRADFGSMVWLDKFPGRNVFIDEVKHKTFIQVDEEGTEAAAVTSVTMALTSAAPMEKPEMIVERPFLFGIRDRHTGTLLFLGKVNQPEWEE